MTDNKNPCSDPSAEFERQRKRKVLLFTAILGCIFLVVLWFIFRPAPVKPQEGAAGINTSVPDGKAQATVGDKRKAAEQLRSEEQQQRRMMTLGDNSFSLLDDGLKPAEEPAPADNPALRASEANRAMQRQVQGFYAAPQRNAEVEALKEQVAALQSQLAALLPDAQEDVLRDVFRFAGVFKQPEHEFPDLGSIKQVEGIECGLVPFGQSGQQFFFFFRSHSLTQN